MRTYSTDKSNADKSVEAAAPPLPPKAIAIIAFAEDLARRSAVMDQKTIARHLGMGASTLSRYARACAQVEAALKPVLPLPTSAMVARALDQLLKEGVGITRILVAGKAGVPPDTVTRVKVENPELGRRIEAAVAASLCNRIEALIRERNSQGLPVTQKWLADEMGVSEGSIVNYKNTDPAIHRIIEDARPFSAVEKVRAALEDLTAEKIPPTIAHIVARSGLHQGTVSKVRKQNVELARCMVNALPMIVRMDRRRAEEGLAARIHLYGDERCNTVASLDRAQVKGGNRALLRACRRLGIVLPKPRPRNMDSLVSYLSRIAQTKPLFEEEAESLWQQAKAGSREAAEELLVRTRPLVAFVIRDELHEDIDPSDFKSSLIEHLISQGDFIITDNWDKWNGKGGLLWHFGRILGEGLREARLSYYYRRKIEKRVLHSISAPLKTSGQDAATFALEDTKQAQSAELSPDVTVGILSDAFPFDEDGMVARRDAALGSTVILSLNKQVMAAALRDVIHDPELSVAFESGVRSEWALFMTGSTGKLGTAILGACAAHLILLTDATPIFTRQTVAVIAGRLSGRMEEREDSLPTVVIGRGKDFKRIMERIAGGDKQYRILRKFIAALNKFGVGLSPRQGMAVIEAVTVGPSAVPSLRLSDTEIYFQTAKNGLKVAASSAGAYSVLIKKLMLRMCRSGTEESAPALRIADDVLSFELSFLEAQKALLENV